MLGALSRDRRGNITVEFALLLPLLMVVFTGMVEISNLIMVEKRVTSSTFAMSDLVSRRATVTDDDLEDIFLAGKIVISPFNAGKLGAYIASVGFDSDGDPQMAWSKSFNGVTYPDALRDAEGMGLKGESVVIVFTRYEYEPIFVDYVLERKYVDKVSFARPRKTKSITKK